MAEEGRPVRVVRPDQRTKGPATPGMERQEAFADDRRWAGFVRTYPGSISGWHHHGEFDTLIYVVTGTLRLEFGPGGADSVECLPGDFVDVPTGVVHRESNPSPEPADVVVVRIGRGESTINVEGPDPA